jgi:uncharacterized membrane protein YsdA (DUF1294 family)/cold shock CspA family protein
VQVEGQELRGRLVRWNDDKGFGFIEIMGSHSDVFLHISALKNMPRRPQKGDLICFTLQRDKNGRSRAGDALIEGVNPVSNSSRAAASRGRRYRISGSALGVFDWLLLTACLLFSAWFLFREHNPLPLFVYLFMSLSTFVAYALDKKKAIDGTWRTSEGSLHLLELLGGWPGGLVAQHRIRHKSKKDSYQAVFWLIVMLHLLLWADYLLFNGRWIWAPLGLV